MLDVVLLALKAGFLILLYVFIWLVFRGAARDVVAWGRAAEPLAAAPPEAAPSRAAPVSYAAEGFRPAPASGAVAGEAAAVAAATASGAGAEQRRAAWSSQPAAQFSQGSPAPSSQPPAPSPLQPRPAPAIVAPATAGAAGEAVASSGVVGGAAASSGIGEVVASSGAAAGAAALEAVAAAPGPESTPEERRARREARAKERTMAGERLDFSAVINPRLVVEESPVLEVGTRYPLDGWVTIGRSPASDIVLADSFVSSTHARLVPRGQLYFVEDLGSTNGTFVDGREVKEAQLKPDNRLRIGETTFRYEE